MAKYAYTVPYGSDNKKIDAAKLPLHNNKKFITAPLLVAVQKCMYGHPKNPVPVL